MLYMYECISSQQNLMNSAPLLFPSYSWVHQGTDSFSSLPKVSGLVKSNARIATQAVGSVAHTPNTAILQCLPGARKESLKETQIRNGGAARQEMK